MDSAPCQLKQCLFVPSQQVFPFHTLCGAALQLFLAQQAIAPYLPNYARDMLGAAVLGGQ